VWTLWSILLAQIIHRLQELNTVWFIKAYTSILLSITLLNRPTDRFLSRVSMPMHAERDIVMANPSVRPSVWRGTSVPPPKKKIWNPHGLTQIDEFWCDNTCGASATPPPKGRAQSSPIFCDDVWELRSNNQILHGDQTTREEDFYTVDHECWRAICLR